jgi:hypothetical protein
MSQLQQQQGVGRGMGLQDKMGTGYLAEVKRQHGMKEFFYTFMNYTILSLQPLC